MSDMTETTSPKSDQINADDLIGGPRTIRVSRVAINPGGEQPVDVFFDGDGGKPYRPCKSMRRVMVAVWGPDATQYVGRSMTIWRDPSVQWGGMEVGGIRISHMSHMDTPLVLALTATKKARKPYRVEPLSQQAAADPAQETATDLIQRFDAAPDATALFALIDDPRVKARRDRLKEARPELWRDVEAAVMAANQRVGSVPA